MNCSFPGQPHLRSKRYAVRNKDRLWPRSGTNPPTVTIPVYIDDSLKKYQNLQKGCEDAITEVESKTCLKFTKHSNESHYVVFARSDDGRSYTSGIGMDLRKSVNTKHRKLVKGYRGFKYGKGAQYLFINKDHNKSVSYHFKYSFTLPTF